MRRYLLAIALMFAMFHCPQGVFAQDTRGDEPFSEFLDKQKKKSLTTGTERVIAESVKKLKEAEQEEEFIETTIFDLYLKERQKGAILANYTEKWFELHNPADAVEQLLPVRNKQKLTELISGRIDNKREIADVGSVEINLDTFQIIVFLDPAMLFAERGSYAKKVPDPESTFNMQQIFRGSSSGEFDSDIDAAFNHRTVSSYGKWISKVDGTAIKDDDYELLEANVGGVLGDYQFETGLAQTDGTIFAPSLEYLGIGFRTAEELYTNIDELRGSAFEIFVPERSRVDFFRSGRLIGSQILEFGLQEVDTRDFPNGSYLVEVVFTNGSGNQRRETRFYTKSGLLTVRDKPNLAVQFGAIRDELEFYDVPVYQVDLKYRLLGWLQAGIGAYGTDDQLIGSFDAIGVVREIIFETGISSSLDGDLAFRGTLSGSFGDFFFSANYLEALGAEEGDDPFEEIEPGPTPTPTPDPKEPDEEEDILNRLDQIGSPTRSFSGQLSYQFGDLRLRYSGSFNESDTSLRRYTHGPSVDWTFIRDGKNTWKVSAAHLTTEDDDRAEFFLTYRRTIERTSVSSQAFQRFESERNETGIRTQYSQDSKAVSGRGTRYAFDNEINQREQEGDAVSVTNNLTVDHASNYTRINAGIRDKRFGEDEFSNFALTGQTAFSVTAEGIEVSRAVNQECVIIVSVESESTTRPVEVLVNNRAVDLIEPGEKMVTGVTCYRSYRVGIRPTEESDLIAYDADSAAVTLFPGNIIKRTWSIDKVHIALGRVVDTEGNPLSWQRIKGTREYVITEETGYFQAEITGRELLTIENADRACTLHLPEVEVGEYFTRYGDVVCR